MKKLILFIAFCLMTAAEVSAQNSIIVKKDGEKIKVDDNTLDVIIVDKRVRYRLVGKTWDKFVTFKDLDYVKTGSILFKSFRLDGKKKDRAFFVLGESKDKKLISMAVTYSTKLSSTNYYEIKVIDKDSNVIESYEFSGIKSDRKKRAAVAPMIRKHFADCPDVIGRLDKFDAEDDDSLEILGFLAEPVYINCQ